MKKGKFRRGMEQFGCSRIAHVSSMLARILPLRVLRWLADGIAAILLVTTSRRQRMADANIAAVFPDLTAAERRRIRVLSLRNLCRTMFELLHLPAVTPEALDQLVEPSDFSDLREAQREGHGAILVSAHYGNWELMAAYVSREVAPMTVVARDAPHSLTASIINSARASHGMTVVGADDAREMLRVLNSGGMLAILPDQRTPSGGLYLDFLGRPGWTATGPALLAARTRARVFVGFSVRDFGGKFRLEGGELELQRTGDREADVAENTRRINAAIGDAIRRHPENWLWLHNRWKQRPTPPPAPEDVSAAS